MYAMMLAAALAAGPQLVWVSVKNEMKPRDTLQLFVDDETKPACEAVPEHMCTSSVEEGTHRFTLKRATDGKVCLEVPPQAVTADLKMEIKECK